MLSDEMGGIFPFVGKKGHFVENYFLFSGNQYTVVITHKGNKERQGHSMSWFVTINAIRKYCSDSRAAQQLLDQANNEMKQAAEELCSVSSGDWVEAFRAEQTKLQGWVAKMISIGTEYIETATRIAEKYEEAENAIKRQIGAR